MRVIAVLIASSLIAVPALADDFDASAHLFGDLGRAALQEKGVTINLQETSELFAVPSGGLRSGVVYDGQTLASVSVDTGKLGLWEGGTFMVSAYQIHGRGPSRNLVGNLQTVSGIEATRATRLDDLFYEQTLLDGKAALRVGQFAADEEFITNQYSAKFINSDFGFPALPANDLPSGGPAYPLATPGVRIKLQPTSSFTVLAAVFNGDPAGPTKGDPQELNASGTSFRTQDGTFSLIEAQYTTDPTDAAQPAPLASTYRLGAWLHSQSFSDQRRDANGVSLASPASTGTGKRRSRDYSLYASVDQRLWSDPRAHAADPKDNGLNRGIGAFARIMGSPDDRNLIDLAVSAGLIWIGAFEDRPADTIGLGVNYARIGRRARALDADMIAAGASTGPVRDSETVVEINYAAQFDWLLLQPSLQYVIHPGGGIANPARPGHVIGDALVLGVRAGITF